MHSLVNSIFLYTCKLWTLTAKLEGRIQTIEMRCFHRLHGISYKDHITDDGVQNRVTNAVGSCTNFLTTVKIWKLMWYGHVMRSAEFAKTILQWTVTGKRKRWEDKTTIWGEGRTERKGAGCQIQWCPSGCPNTGYWLIDWWKIFLSCGNSFQQKM